MDRYHPIPARPVRLIKDTPIQVEIEERKTRKNNSPSPSSYAVAEAYERSSGSPANDKSGRNFIKFNKDKRVTLMDEIREKSKKLPGVGKYSAHTAIDKVYRPMKAPKNA